MTNPSDPWAHRPDSPDTPTEKLGAPGRGSDDAPTHTTDYSEAYGESPDPYQSTQPYGHPGPYEQTAPYEFPAHPQYPGQFFDQPPGPNATRELPPYDSQWGAYEAGGYPPYGPDPAAGPSGSGPPGPVGPTGLPVEEPHRRRTGLWIALAAAVFVLVVLGGIATGLMLADKNAADTEALTTRAPTSVPVVPNGPDSGGPEPNLPPGLGELGGIGATMGTVSSNDGSTLMVKSLLGNSITVRTDGQTQVISMGSGSVADLKSGDMVVIQGDKSADGSILAKIIISTQVPR